MKALFAALALVISASSMAQTCYFKQELLYKPKNGSFKVASATLNEGFDLTTGEFVTGNGSVLSANCVKHGNYTSFLGKWEEVNFCYNVVARNNLLVWNLDNGQRRTFGTAESEASDNAAFFPVGKNHYLGLSLSFCK